MNPLLECFASFIVWAEAGSVTASRTPEQVFGHRHWQIMSRAQRLLPPGKSRLLCGVLGLMLFRAADWRAARETLSEAPPSDWRDAILPKGIQPARLLKAITMSSEAVALLVDMGFGQDSALAASFTTFLAHPKSLRLEILSLLDEAWEGGLSEWWKQVGPAVRTATRDLAPMAGSQICEIPVAMLAAGRLRLSTPAGELLLVPMPQPSEPVARTTEAPEPATRRSLTGQATTVRSRPSTSPAKPPEQQAPVRRASAMSEARAAKAAQEAEESSASVRRIEVFRALSDSTRIAIISELTRAPSFPGTLAAQLGVSPPTMSHHVSVLRQAGLVKVTRRQGFSELTLKHDVLREAAEALLQLAGGTNQDGASN